MKATRWMLLTLTLTSAVWAERTIPLEEWGSITVPDACAIGKPFDITVTLRQVEAPTRLTVTANWKKAGGQWGGFLQRLQAQREVSEAGAHTFTVTITKTRPELGSIVLSAYLAPDGEWKSATHQGIAEIPLAPAAGGAMQDLGAKSEQTPKAVPFFMDRAPRLPSLQEGGFAQQATFVDEFDPGWPKQKTLWQVATWKQNGTQMDPERCRVNEDGQLVQTVTAGMPPRGGSLQTRHEYGYGRWIARIKPSATPGVLNSFFTKDWDDLTTATPNNDGNKGEVDIELLSHTYGENKGEVHLAIHLLEHHPLWHLDIPLDFNPSDDFHEWGFDILPDKVIWHVDGRILHQWAYTDTFRIDENYEVFFNSWTMQKWIQGPPKEDAHYLIDWVKFHPLLTAAPQKAPPSSTP